MDTTQVQTLWKTMEALKDADQLETALSASLDIIREATGSNKGSIWMMDERRSRAICMMSSGTFNAVGESAASGEGLIGEAIQSGRSKRYTAEEVSGRRLAGADTPAMGAKNLMIVPIRATGEALGGIVLSGKRTAYTEDDERICESCSAVIALDIEDKGFEFKPFEDKEPLVTATGIIKEFKSGEEMRRILKGVDLDIYPGELVVVLGESGCGKSTLLNIIGGMDLMTEGKLIVDGKDMSRPTEDELTEYRRAYVGFIFQSYNLMPNLSAYENVEFIGEISDNPMDSMEALKLVGLDEKSESMPSALSGGQMQRVSIARALVKNPKIILADEPTAALDYDTSIKVLKVIEEIAKNRNTTVLMVTHNPEIAKMANRVVKLRDGIISSIRVNLKPMKAADLVW